jgi:hypothetical protein
LTNLNLNVTVYPVVTKKDLNDFVMLPWQVYKNNKNWVPPLITDVKETLSKTKNPFFTHADRELYLARKDNTIVGRIAAIVDYNYCKYHKNKIGFFGFFESVEDYSVSHALFAKALEFIKSKSMTEMYGPANPSMNDEAGFLLEGFDTSPMIKMTYNPSYYLEYAERFGMKKVKDLYAYLIDISKPPPEKLVRVIESLKRKKGIVVRPINIKNLKADLINIKDTKL